nr:hypothetical protein [Chloroflexia bacterium]
VGWSYDLLSEAEKQLFRRLSVFVGGFTLDAAGFVAAWPEPPMADESVIDAIGGLVDQSLVQVMTEGPESRFRMLETIREYGVRQVEDIDHDEVARLAHAEYCRTLAERAEPALMGPDQGAWMDALDSELPNIRAAMAWLEAQARLDDAISVQTQIQFFLNIRGHAVEGVRRLDAWLELPDLAARSRSRGLALLGAGSLRQNVGDTERSSSMLVESANILSEVGDAWHACMALGIAGATYYQQGDLKRLKCTALASLEIAERIGHSRQISANLGHLSMVAMMNGDHKLAKDLQQRSYQVAEAAGDRWLIAFRSAALADEELRAGNLDRAARHAMEARDHFSELGSRRDLPSAWEQMSRIARKQGNLETAADYAATALSIAETCGYSWSVAWGHLQLGIIATDQGMPEHSLNALTNAMKLFRAKDQPWALADCLDAFAVLAARTGDVEGAARFLGASAARNQETGIAQELWEPDSSLASVVESLRARLGEERFEFLKAEGASLTVDDAVSGALAYTLPASHAALGPDPVKTGRQHGLSPRELEVLMLMANGLSNQQIADTLFLSQRTITTHVTGIFGKLDLSSRTAAVSFAIRSGIA